MYILISKYRVNNDQNYQQNSCHKCIYGRIVIDCQLCWIKHRQKKAFWQEKILAKFFSSQIQMKHFHIFCNLSCFFFIDLDFVEADVQLTICLILMPWVRILHFCFPKAKNGTESCTFNIGKIQTFLRYRQKKHVDTLSRYTDIPFHYKLICANLFVPDCQTLKIK